MHSYTQHYRFRGGLLLNDFHAGAVNVTEETNGGYPNKDPNVMEAGAVSGSLTSRV